MERLHPLVSPKTSRWTQLRHPAFGALPSAGNTKGRGPLWRLNDNAHAHARAFGLVLGQLPRAQCISSCSRFSIRIGCLVLVDSVGREMEVAYELERWGLADRVS